MIELIKLSENDVKDLNFENLDKKEVYAFKKDAVTIGISYINNIDKNSNILWIYILAEYQSNGYGTLLFDEMLKILKEMGYKEFILNIDKANTRIINIIMKHKSLLLGTNGDMQRYVVDLA